MSNKKKQKRKRNLFLLEQKIAQFVDLINSFYNIASRRSLFFMIVYIYGIICILDENVSSSNPIIIIIILKPFLSSRVYILRSLNFSFVLLLLLVVSKRIKNSDMKAAAVVLEGSMHADRAIFFFFFFFVFLFLFLPYALILFSLPLHI